MKLYKSPVAFRERPHGYHLGEKRLSGITSLIHEVLRLGVYPDASDYVRNFCVPRAGEYGTSVHHAIESYDQLGIKVTRHPKSPQYQNGDNDQVWDVADELEGYIRNRAGYSPLANEYTVSDEQWYASNIDNIWIKDATQGIWLVDTKTNNLELYPGGEAALQEYLSWQLSIYAYLFERQNPGLKVEGLACNWLRKKDSRFWEIRRKTDEDVERLLSVHWTEIDGRIIYDIMEAEKLGILAKESVPAVAPPYGMIVAQEVVDAIHGLLKEQAEAEAKVKELKAKLREAMEANGIKSWDSGKFKATIAADSTAATFDTRRFKSEHPELYKQYTKQTPKKGGFTITLREK